ncbi:MAG TPA: 50S ribosomal protein L11 methyltransferase [Vicinamibacteria bacterium]|nr:50S ribosomal protein L11 methyltransferase [Vicinamibacteria bacterium]
MRPSATEPVVFRVTVSLDGEELALAGLFELDTLGAESRPGPSPQQTVLMAYFTGRPGLEEELRQVLGRVPGVEVERAEVPDVDWVARFRESFKALSAGTFLIAPAWEVPEPAAGQRLLRVDPGRAFGTGTHETTRLCLAALQARAEAGPLGRVLDVGTGSGILAVASCLLGAATVTAVDHDPEAVASAQLHARLNGVAFSLVRGDGGRPLRPGRFDLVLANLQAPLLLARRAELLALCAAGGRLILSGLLQDDLPAIRAAYGDAATLSPSHDGEWVAVEVAPLGPPS